MLLVDEVDNRVGMGMGMGMETVNLKDYINGC
jgi:hypothetical protein